MPELEPPTDQVLDMLQRGLPNERIIEQLQEQGYSFEEISEALSQAETKLGIEGIPAPSDQDLKPSILDKGVSIEEPKVYKKEIQKIDYTEPISRGSTERIEEIAESIINEKWQHYIEEIGDLNIWKEKIKNDITSIKQELLRLENRFEALQSALIGKIKDYDKNVNDLGTDVKALSKIIENIAKPLASNVKELSKIVDKVKK